MGLRKERLMGSRVLYQDIKPYDVPASLGTLHGPSSGVLILPLDVYWGPDPEADLDTLSGVTKAYQSILREGASEVQEALLNRDVLLRTWDELLLPVRVRSLWESRFPELTA
jgi:hypothetical protein